MLGRHQESCRLDGAEDPARAAALRVRSALELCGLDPDRARFDVPAPGRGEPARLVAEYVAGTEGGLPRLDAGELPAGPGLDADLALLAALCRETSLRPNPLPWLKSPSWSCLSST